MLLVGGVFNEDSHRPSRVVSKMYSALSEYFDIIMFNGGTYQTLKNITAMKIDINAIMWMADVPNDLPKLLSDIVSVHKDSFFVQSKNNISEKYTNEDLKERIALSGADALLEIRKEDQFVFSYHINDSQTEFTNDIEIVASKYQELYENWTNKVIE